MAYYAITYEYTDAPELRDEHRPRHVAFLAGQHEAGRLLVSGPLDGGSQALLVFTADDPEELEGTLDGDPFHQEGLIARRSITLWNVFFGSDRLASNR